MTARQIVDGVWFPDYEKMKDKACAWWDRPTRRAEDCRVVEAYADGRPCLIVVHGPTGCVSTEAGDDGRWTLDGRAWGC